MKAKFNYPLEFKSLPAYSAHRGQIITVGEKVDKGIEDTTIEPLFRITAEDGWEGHALQSELEYL